MPAPGLAAAGTAGDSASEAVLAGPALLLPRVAVTFIAKSTAPGPTS